MTLPRICLRSPSLAKEMSWAAMDYANINFWFQVGYAMALCCKAD